MKSELENDRLLLSHMLTAARIASQLVRGETRDTASSSLQVNFSLRYAVQVIGEAANHLTDGMKRKKRAHPLDSNCWNATQAGSRL